MMRQCCAGAVVAACEEQSKYIAELEAKIADRPEPQRVADATRDRALDLLARIVKRVEKAGGHSWPGEQADMRAAKALIAEQGRRGA